MRELWDRIESLEHERGRLRQALTDLSCEFAALQERIRILLRHSPRQACIEADRADSDPRKENKHDAR